MALSERDRQMLDLERTWRFEPGAKAARIRARLGLSTTRYYRLLGELIDRHEALGSDPLLVRRLRRERAERRRTRYEGPRVHQGSGK